LLPGLEPLGVPRELTNTAFPFRYNKIEDLEALARKYGGQIGVIIMEPMRKSLPENNFLQQVRRIADEINAVLIFDEVTSGFRLVQGGVHLHFGVEPDIAVFGKALGNGYPISAVVGRREVMDHAQDTFISSTLWTERIGFAAGLATLRKMEMCDVQKRIIHYGEYITSGWKRIAEKHGLEIQVGGIPSLCHLSFGYDKPLEVQTLYAQEMLERGYLVGAAIATTYAYTDEIIDQFISDSDAVFEVIKKAVDSNNVRQYLKGDVIDIGFKRLT
jgi:glutamate-1-semialdehyde aminotransferase